MSAPAIPSFDEFSKKQQPANIPTFDEFSSGARPGIAPHDPTLMEKAGRAGSAFLENINPTPAVRAIMNPRETASRMFSATSGAVGRTREALSKGQLGEAAKSAVGAVPVFGPAAEQITREATGGQIPEAIGHTAGIIAGPKLLGAAGKGLMRAAEPLAESSLGIRAVNRAYGKTPGRAALEETRGFSPGKVAESAQQKLGQLTPELEQHAAASTAPANLQPAIDLIRNQAMKLRGQNQRLAVQQLGPMEEHLTKSATTGMPLSRIQSPRGLLELKRGFGDEFVKNWNPETMTGTRGTAGRVYHELGQEFERAVPQAASLNQRISSLIPVAERGEAAELNAPLGQRIAHRVAAHTGALAGAALGYHEAGIPGAIAGLVVPELLSSPAPKMAAARGLNLTGKILQNPAVKQGQRIAPLTREREGGK